MTTLGATEAPRIPDATKLAVERTRLAYERTLMAWVRTATSLISFGFTLFKFFEFLHQDGKGATPPQILGARTFALMMISVGLLSLAISTVQHNQSMRALRREYRDVPWSLAALMAALIGLLGIVGFLSVILRY